MFIYDTQHLKPFAFVTDVHYSNLSDLSWSCDGRILIVTSIDGFCTFIKFETDELGTVYTEPESSSSSNLLSSPSHTTPISVS